jgi:hypothetical protein
MITVNLSQHLFATLRNTEFHTPQIFFAGVAHYEFTLF